MRHFMQFRLMMALFIPAALALIIPLPSWADDMEESTVITSDELPLTRSTADDPLTPFQASAYAPDPSSDIGWSCGTSGVASIQCAFNNARAAENTQFGTSLP